MSGLSLILQCSLACVLILLACLSAQLGALTLLRFFRPHRPVRMPLLPDEALPRVLVQLPVCDEGDLALRVVAAAAKLDWPATGSRYNFWTTVRPTSTKRWQRLSQISCPQE